MFLAYPLFAGILALISFVYFPGIVCASEAVTRALDQYESGQTTARQQMTQTSSQASYQKRVSKESSGVVQNEALTMAKKLWSLEMGFETYHYKYEETVGGDHFMDLEGTFSGLYAKMILYPKTEKGDFFYDYVDHLILDARLAWGDMDYTGGVTDGWGNSYPAVTNDSPNEVFEVRVLFAKDLAWQSMIVAPYAGVGYRHLTDDSSEESTSILWAGEWFDIGAVGYRRKSNYTYLPVGCDITRSFGSGWKVGLNTEFDILLYGKQVSKTPYEGTNPDTGEELVFPIITNMQNTGYGLRTSLRLEKIFRTFGITIEPFFRYWDIENSDMARWDKDQTETVDTDWVGSAYEPSNVTQELGMKVGMIF